MTRLTGMSSLRRATKDRRTTGEIFTPTDVSELESQNSNHTATFGQWRLDTVTCLSRNDEMSKNITPQPHASEKSSTLITSQPLPISQTTCETITSTTANTLGRAQLGESQRACTARPWSASGVRTGGFDEMKEARQESEPAPTAAVSMTAPAATSVLSTTTPDRTALAGAWGYTSVLGS